MLLIVIIIVVVFISSGLGMYIYLSSPVNKKSDASIEVVIKSGSSVKQIAKELKQKNLIKNTLFFQFYVKLSNVNSLKATTYVFKKSMSLKEIVKSLEEGNSYNPDVISITFKEGKRITDYAKEIEKKTTNTYEDVIAVMQDKVYIKTLIDKYWFLTDKILDENIYYPLEGYLAANTYDFANKNVAVKDIVETMLQEMDNMLKKYKNYSDIHSYITMASLVELEGTNTENRKMIVGVFNNRIDAKMNLGSDVSTYYALQVPMTSDLTAEQFGFVSPYNTRGANMIGKLPIGPICSISKSSLEASFNPTKNDYLYFVADKYGNIFYTKTNAEHVAKVNEIKEKGDWLW